MKLIIDIPDEQIEKSLEESKYIHEDEGEKGSVHIVLLYTNKKLEFVDISRKTDFYSLTDKYTILPEGHGRLIDADALEKEIVNGIKAGNYEEGYETFAHINDMDDCLECVKYADTIIEADKDCRECKVEHDCYECEKYAESEDE